TFLRLCQELGLFVYFRPGPYITNEMDGGGVPGWLMDRTTKKSTKADGKVNLRTDDPDYLFYVQRYLRALNTHIKPFLASQGGPIVLYSLENEYNWFATFHEIDKLFWHEGGAERDLGARVPARAYLSALRDMVRADGIDVPLTTCPGDGKASWTGDVEDVIPMPNIYGGLGGANAEQIVVDLLKDMHNPNAHGGVYANMPSGTTETDRDPSRIKRMILAGLDATFAFNVVGMQQEGYRNALVLNANPSNALRTVFDFSALENVLTGFVSPTVGYFHNIIDYGGAISPAGLLRPSFHSFRRDNLFFDAVEPWLAAGKIAQRARAGSDAELRIHHAGLGAQEGNQRFHHWLEGAQDTTFISLVNATGKAQTLNLNGIEYRQLRFPRFAPLHVPTRVQAGPGQFGESDTSEALALPLNLPVEGVGRLQYTTAGLLTLRRFNDEQLLIVHGVAGQRYELALTDLRGTLQIEHQDAGMRIEERTTNGLTLTLQIGELQQIRLRTADGQRLRIIGMDREQAGRVWFESIQGQDVLISGADLIRPSGTGTLDTLLPSGRNTLTLLSARPLTLGGDYHAAGAWDGMRGLQRIDTRTTLDPQALATLPLHQGRLHHDDAERLPEASRSGWRTLGNAPAPLETQGITHGHAWYKAELHLEGWNWLPLWEPTHLYIQHASDIVGIYVNGTYLTTMAPVGTELNSSSHNPNYQFPSLRPYLKQGRNVIAFRTEVWGHGSFMWPRGTLAGTQARIPALGFDAVKGLHGEAKVGWRNLTHWQVIGGLSGQAAGYAAPDHDDRNWSTHSLPGTLDKGRVSWYRTRFDRAALADASRQLAPQVLELKGRNAKATIYLNGRLIGRWLSDTEWLGRGFWGRAQRDMWMNTSPDHFPIPQDMLRPAGEDNVLAIVVEDTSSDMQAPGRIDTLQLRPAQENGEQGVNQWARRTLVLR
ncbi:MAG: beta-galactosidase, partial [Gammaproteobacteria bacterium]|nr:beta-galactosidase [Gammaproteobacteria bacterium]